MFGSEVLEIAVGLALTYGLLAILCTALTEYFSRLVGLRSNTLKKGIRNLLDDPDGTGLAREFYDHPLIKSLSFKRGRAGLFGRAGKPSYITAKQFATVLLDSVLPSGTSGPSTFKELREAVVALPSVEVRRELLALIDSAEDNIAQARQSIEEWFDSGMDRVSGWYKRNAQLFTLIAALVVTLVFNADTTAIADQLAKDQVVRDTLVATAQNVSLEDFADAKVFDQALTDQIDELGLPFGWFQDGKFQLLTEEQRWYGKVIGLLITAIAVSLGAPFWFDMLGKIGSLRAAGKPPQKTGG